MLLTDSIAKYVDGITNCKIKVFRGATIMTIKEIVRREVVDISQINNMIIHVGTNDIKSGSADIIMARYSALTEVVLFKNPSINLILSAILPRPVDISEYGNKVIIINQKLKQYCKERGVGFTDTTKYFRDGYCPKRHLYAYLDGGLHLNRQGTRILRNFFIDVLCHQKIV